MKKLFSLHKARQIQRHAYSFYKSQRHILSPADLATFEAHMAALDQALLSKNKTEADRLAHILDEFCNAHFKRSIFHYTWELAVAIILALLIATVVRQMWFEPYEIPTGSMRPTFKEKDHLTVTKTAFGLNIPLKTEHFYFDPNLVQRSSIVIFSGDKLPMRDTETTYFWVFPYTKRYVKRLMGKPGDTLYFYGGQIYAIDKEGNPVPELLHSPWLQNLEYIPFLSFDGEISANSSRQVLFQQMHLPLGRLIFSPFGKVTGEIFNGKEWIPDQPLSQKEPHQTIQTYSDFWGMRNYAMARLLTKDQLREYTDIDMNGIEEAPLYLELRHTPNLTNPKPTFVEEQMRLSLMLTPFTTIIPLQEKHLNAIMDHMYTARFVVNDGKAARYSLEDSYGGGNNPRFKGVDNGTYEFYYGKAYRVGWGAITENLPPDHPLYSHEPANIQKLYNLGLNFETSYAPYSKKQMTFPHRYAYFRDGDLYLLGAPIIKKDDPVLIAFLEKEMAKEKQSTSARPYLAFRDYGPPVKEGSLDKEFMHTFGLTIPDHQYLVLGDNHAMSADSRVFGFVPENNLQGAPSVLVWPPGSRWGFPPQKPYPIFVLPRLIVWGIAALVLLIWYIIYTIRSKRPIFKKL